MPRSKALRLGKDGWCDGVEHLASSHFNERPEGVTPTLVILHCISLPPGCFATGDVVELFLGTLDVTKDPRLADLAGLRVSSHFFIARDGKVFQFVSCNDRAWHAGVSSFMGCDNCNDYSVGIELEGTESEPFQKAQYAALLEVLKALSRRYAIGAVVAHSDVAPGRKTDPGPYFDWQYLQRRKSAFGNPEFPGAAACMEKAVYDASLTHRLT